LCDNVNIDGTVRLPRNHQGYLDILSSKIQKRWRGARRRVSKRVSWASAIGVSSSLLNVSRERRRAHATARICPATIAQVRGANWLRFLRHTPSLAAIDFDPSVRSRNIERNYGQFTMPSSPSPNAYPPRGPCRPAAGPVIARRWIGPRIDCFGISIPILRAQPINAPARERGVGVHAAPANATARPL